MGELPPQETKKGPLIASVGQTHEHFYDSEGWEALQQRSVNVDYYTHPNLLARSGMRNAGYKTYMLSGIDAYPKYSDTYRNCMGVAVVGVDQTTGENVSFLTHQNPSAFLGRQREQFEQDLRALAQEFFARVRPDTIEVALFGGYYSDEQDPNIGMSLSEAYSVGTTLVSTILKKELGVEPHVAIGPSHPQRGSTAGLLDTENRRLFIEYPDQEDHRYNTSFPASNLPEAEDTWQNAA